jgi:hypothetical protein
MQGTRRGHANWLAEPGRPHVALSTLHTARQCGESACPRSAASPSHRDRRSPNPLPACSSPIGTYANAYILDPNWPITLLCMRQNLTGSRLPWTPTPL